MSRRSRNRELKGDKEIYCSPKFDRLDLEMVIL